MYPYINLPWSFHLGAFQFGPFHFGTFGLLLWFAAVCGTYILYLNFNRNGIDADALNVVTLVVLAGIVGAKLWHELENVPELVAAWRHIMLPGLSHPVDILLGFLHWFAAGFAWYGGLLAGIATLYWQGTVARFKGPLAGTQGARIGGIRMLDLAAPAAALGYGVGRIGCLTSGDGDYGINTRLPWGVHLAHGLDQYHRALVPPYPTDALVQPTPIYELLFSILVFWVLWNLGKKSTPVGWLTGVYLVFAGFGRFMVEFVRVNPKIYWGMSNAQIAALGSILVGTAAIFIASKVNRQWFPELDSDRRT